MLFNSNKSLMLTCTLVTHFIIVLSCDLIIQVDIFSLGMTMYELMTLQTLPPEDVDVLDFDSDIKDGIRPSFLEEVFVLQVIVI